MPALNEGETIQSVIKTIPKSFSGFKQVKVLVVDDGSTDNTVTEAETASAKVISHKVK